MGKIFTQTINRFDGGSSEDKRVKDFSKFSITKHFDVFTYPHKLVPFSRIQASAGENKELKIVKFVYAPWLSSGEYRLFGLGVVNGTTKIKIFLNDVDAGADTWEVPSDGEGSTNARSEKVFFYYKSYLYAFTGGVYLSRFNTATSAFTNIYQPLSYINLAQPVHHPNDDIAYFFTDNRVHTLNNATFSQDALTLPDNFKITSACAYGNYLAIGCSTTSTVGQRSVVFLWDRDSSLATITDRIDFGEGELKHLVVLDNKLIGVVEKYLSQGYFNAFGGSILIKQASGNTSVILKEITADASVGTVGEGPMPATRVVSDEKLYIPMEATLDGDARRGIWVIDSNGKATIAFLMDETPTVFNGIYAIGNTWWVAHSDDGSVNRSGRSDYAGQYSSVQASIYESLILDGGDSFQNKKLMKVKVTTEPLPANASVTLKYRKNEETDWTTIFTHTSTNSLGHYAVNIESTGATLPEFKELQLRVESLSGAVITSIQYEYELIDS